ncbi:MAG: DUF2335 domain-containing protein [Phycisphaerales bacterium]|jgi:uncharacterized membrane protein|nr:DUF2335 domain-containing protein [Phycisphaerales bacterium]
MARENKNNRSLRRQQEQQLEILQEFQVTHHSGPLPPPDQLDHYNKVSPGMADRIMRAAEAESEHRRYLEKQLLEAQIADVQIERRIEMRGQIFALVVSCLAILGGIIVVINGYAIAGTLLSGATIVSLVGLFIYGRERLRTSTAHKQQQNTEEKIETKPEITKQ